MKETLYNIPTAILQLITAEQAYKYRVVPVKKSSKAITLKTDAIATDILVQELEIVLGVSIRLEKETTENLNKYLQINYRKRDVTSQNSTLYYSEYFLLNMIFEAKEIGCYRSRING